MNHPRGQTPIPDDRQGNRRADRRGKGLSSTEAHDPHRVLSDYMSHALASPGESADVPDDRCRFSLTTCAD